MKTRRSHGRRLAISVLMVFTIVVVFVVRLVDIQLVQADELNAQSYDKRAQELITYGVRGDIVDTNGVVLADSVDRYDIEASPRIALSALNLPSTQKHIADIAAATGQDPTALMALLTKDPESDFLILAKGVTLEVYRAVRALDIPWAYYDLRPSRTYPNGAVAGNLVGFVGTDGPQAGEELSGDSCLASNNGTATYEKGEDGVRIPGSLVTETQAKNGGTLKLTIDRDLQWFVQQRIAQTFNELGATWMTAVVIRVKDGHLMAVADYPSVDPNNVSGVGVGSLGSLAFSTPYEPGSTMKSLTAASLIDAGVATPATQIIAPGRIYFPNGDYIKDAWAHDDVRYTMAGALVNSSNVGISKLTDLLGAQNRHDYMIKFGLNSKTEVDFNGESSGDVHPASDWDQITNYAVQFGQGMTATSVQMASIYQTLANGGVRMPVTLVEGCQHADGTVTDLPSDQGTRVVSAKAATETVQMLENVVTNDGLQTDLTIPGYRVAAKTGTAQVAENGVYGDKTVISVAGMAPAENPQYAIVVTAGIPSSMYISSAVAPTFRDIMAHTLTTYRVPPSTEPAPDVPLNW
ncbi:MAG: penicillin-binding protein 2 [Rhodoglobus sp.]